MVTHEEAKKLYGRGSIVSPVAPFNQDYWKRVDASRHGQTGGECCLCGKPIRGEARFYIAIDLGDHSLWPASVPSDAIDAIGDYSIERVGSACARKLTKLGVLRGPNGEAL